MIRFVKILKILIEKTITENVLRDKAFNIAKNPKYDGYKRGLVSMVYKYFDKILFGRAIKMDLFLVKN